MRPRPVAVDEQLPLPIYACKLLCRLCRTSLLYQRQERPRFPRHFYWCPICRARYAAADLAPTYLPLQLGILAESVAIAGAESDAPAPVRISGRGRSAL